MPDRQKSEQERINQLIGEISRHRYLYYNERPEISDAKYDSLEDEFRETDPENPLLFKIGIDSSELFTKREHIIPMMIDVLNTNKITIQEVRKMGGKLEVEIDGKKVKLSFCITGSLENFKPRSKAEELVIRLGGIVKKNVTKDLHYLVTNSDEPTKKYLAAQSQENTQIISEAGFIKMTE